MDNKEFVKTFCSNDVIQAFLKELGYDWDGKDIADNVYGSEGSCEDIWLVSEEALFPLPSQLKISPLSFTIREMHYDRKRNVLHCNDVEYGAKWREFMTKNNEHYLLVAAESLDDLRDQVLKCYDARDKMFESLSEIQWSFGKKIFEAANDAEWCKLNSDLKTIQAHIREAIDKKSAEIKKLEETIVEINKGVSSLSHENQDKTEREM